MNIRERLSIRKTVVLMCLYDGKTGELIAKCQTENLITDAGDRYYAQRGGGATPDNAFGIMELGTAGNVPAKTSNRSDVTALVALSQKVFDATYPQVDDPDPDNVANAGPDTLTYRTSWSTTEANDITTIDRVIITNLAPGAAEPLLMYAEGLAVDKDNTKTLKGFINHTFNGVP